MSAELIGQFEGGSPEWHAARANGLGGSEIAAVLGLSPYTSHYSLWLQKAGIISDPTKVTPPMEAGHRLESVILQWFWEQHPHFAGQAITGTYHHSDRPWQIANPDSLVLADSPAVIEAKFALYDYEWGREGTDEIPAHYLCQCQWYMDVFGIDVCYVPVFVGSTGEFREYVVRANYADQQLMRDAGTAFMASLAAGMRPSLDDHDATYQAVRLEHPGIDREATVEIPADVLNAYLDSRNASDEATAAHRLAKSTVLDLMGGARLATLGGENVLRRQPGAHGSIALHPVRTSRSAA